MKARWLIITVLLAFPFAFAFFLGEARLGEKRPARRALVIAPPLASTSPGSKPPSPAETPVERPEPQPAQTENPSAASDNVAATQPPPSVEKTKPVLLSGTFTNEDNSLVYDADAKLLLSKDVVLSSPTGVMVSNEKQTLFAGDMQIESAKNIITAHEGVLDTTTNKMTATVASISFTNENNQLVRMTGENVTLELPIGEKSPTPNTILADSVTVESPAASTTPKP